MEGVHDRVAGDQCLAEMTAARVSYLRRAFGAARAAQAIAGPGEYDDGLGGLLSLKASGEALHLRIEVVRGPTVHLGEIEGQFRWIDRRAELRIASEDDSEAPLCILRLQAASHGRIVVEKENCDYYHGARAYFDGVYRPISGR